MRKKEDRYSKADLSKVVDKDTIDAMREVSEKRNKRKVLLRIDDKTQVSVFAELATPEYAEELRRKYGRV